jgi:Na+/H+-translocating membrane pyrophosphatase
VVAVVAGALTVFGPVTDPSGAVTVLAGVLAAFVQVTDTLEEVRVPARLVTVAWSVSVPLLVLV